MADIQTTVLKKYGIDIAQENIFKLYKLEKADLNPQELQNAIDATRKRWTQSVNGANEKNAKRDGERLAKADKYEAVLKDDRLRKEVFAFYNGKKNGSNATGNTEFAKEYFKLIETSKKLKKEDVEFFFAYYPAEKKNKKAIVEMLQKEFKIPGIGSKGVEEESGEESGEESTSGEKNKKEKPFIVNLFQKETIFKIRKMFEYYATAKQTSEVIKKYPQIEESLYEYLRLDETDTLTRLQTFVNSMKTEVFNVRQEKGSDFICMVDLFNKLGELCECQDVVDNFEEFKLLVKYPSLTPYMYSFVEMKKPTLKGLMDVANKEYVFRDEADFIISYYNPVRDNFGITNSTAILQIIKKAQKQAKANKVLDELDKKLGRKKQRKLAFLPTLLYWLTYWPIFLLYFVFEVFRAIFTQLGKLAIPVFGVLFVAMNILLPKTLGMDNLLVFRKLLMKEEWLSYLQESIGITTDNIVSLILYSLLIFVIFLIIYALPPLLVALFVSEAADNLNKQYDWIGVERTFQNIFQKLKQKVDTQFREKKQYFIKSSVFKILINVLCVAIVCILVKVVPMGFKAFSEKTGYFQKTEPVVQEEQSDYLMEEDMVATEADKVMVVTVSSANIRSGPGTDYGVVTTGVEGQEYIATGNQEEKSSGRIWYEIYLDDAREQTGWASSKVISEKE